MWKWGENTSPNVNSAGGKDIAEGRMTEKVGNIKKKSKINVDLLF